MRLNAPLRGTLPIPRNNSRGDGERYMVIGKRENA